MDCHKFEEIISHHCSPVLMGEKPANLVSFSKEKMPELPDIMKMYEEKFADEDIYMEVICGCRKHYLVLVYRKEVLEEYLKQPEVVELLVQDGYSKNGELKEKFSYLRKRFEEKKEFILPRYGKQITAILYRADQVLPYSDFEVTEVKLRETGENRVAVLPKHSVMLIQMKKE